MLKTVAIYLVTGTADWHGFLNVRHDHGVGRRHVPDENGCILSLDAQRRSSTKQENRQSWQAASGDQGLSFRANWLNAAS